MSNTIYRVKAYVMSSGMQPPGDWELLRTFDTEAQAREWVQGNFVTHVPRFVEASRGRWLNTDDFRNVTIEEFKAT